MTAALEVFQFPATGQQVRMHLRDGEPWFVAADVCGALGVANTSQAVSYLDDDERFTLTTDEGRPLNIVNEPGLYSLILRSRKAEAKVFKRWVTHDVLPAIRKNGRYEAPVPTFSPLPIEGQMRVLQLATGLVDPAWLEAKTRHTIARALGEQPEIDPATRPLTVGEYLQDRGLSGAALRSASTKFGRRLKALYRETHGAEPAQVERFVDNALRPVAGYTEADRGLFDTVWTESYATKAVAA